MDDTLEALKAELERFGEANDAATTERARRMLNITRDTGEFLALLVRATGAWRVLEIGTSNGYSTLWLADAAKKIGGSVTTGSSPTTRSDSPRPTSRALAFRRSLDW
jgi:predicted O-methyltransferase YrrM